jgi:hypothetical protein
MVIDNETRVCARGKPGKHQCNFINIFSRPVLAPVLEDIHPCVNRLSHCRIQSDAEKILIKDQAEPFYITMPGYCTAP